MVSPIHPDTSTASYVAPNRGFIPEETVVAQGPGSAQITYYRPFWRPVLAGTLMAFSIFTLSWYLMLGFHVGIESNGMMALGGGAALWLWVTACVAYFFGGFVASAMTASTRGETPAVMASAALKGAVIWGVSIPLALVLYGFIAQNAGGMLAALNLPRPGILENANAAIPHLGYYWSIFIGMGCALIFSLIGSTTAAAACAKAA